MLINQKIKEQKNVKNFNGPQKPRLKFLTFSLLLYAALLLLLTSIFPHSYHTPYLVSFSYPLCTPFVSFLYTLQHKKGAVQKRPIKASPFRQMPILAMLYFYTCCVWRFFTFCFKKGMTSAIFLLRAFFYSPLSAEKRTIGTCVRREEA